MQSFIILCKFFLEYKAGVDAETGAWDRALAVMGVEIISTTTSLG